MVFTEQNNVAIVLAPVADAYASDPATDVINMAEYDHVTFVLQEGAGGTGTVKIQVEECTAMAGTGATAIPFNYRVGTVGTISGDLTASAASGYTTAAGANKQVAIEIDAAELSDGYSFVRLQLTEVVDSPCAASVLAICSKPRYPQSRLTSPIV